jgi:hypothetical protein
MKRSWIAVVMAFFVFLLVAGCGKDKKEEGKAAMAQELSAMIMSTSAGQKTNMKVYMKPDKYRMDMEAAGSSTIAREDINKVWILMTQQKTYMEMPGYQNSQPDSLFEVPSDYKKISIPGMPTGRKIKIPGRE